MTPSNLAAYAIGTRVRITFTGWGDETLPDGKTVRARVTEKVEGVIVAHHTTKGKHRGARPCSAIVVAPSDGSENVYGYERSQIKVLAAV